MAPAFVSASSNASLVSQMSRQLKNARSQSMTFSTNASMRLQMLCTMLMTSRMPSIATPASLTSSSPICASRSTVWCARSTTQCVTALAACSMPCQTSPAKFRKSSQDRPRLPGLQPRPVRLQIVQAGERR